MSAASEGPDVEALRQKHQRDVNCLSDPDRSTRKRALTKLTKALLDDRVGWEKRWTSGEAISYRCEKKACLCQFALAHRP